MSVVTPAAPSASLSPLAASLLPLLRALDQQEHLHATMLERLAALLVTRTGRTSSGYPYLEAHAWHALRDGLPHLFAMGSALLDVLEGLEALPAGDIGSLSDALHEQEVRDASKVIGQVIKTAAITAPPDLWLLHHVLSTLDELGLSQRLLDGDALSPEYCVDQEGARLDAEQLDADLSFLLSRGLVEQYDEGYRIAGHQRARRAFEQIKARQAHAPSSLTSLWRDLFTGAAVQTSDLSQLLEAAYSCPPPRRDPEQNHWIATVDEIDIGFRLVPLVLGLRAAELSSSFREGSTIEASRLSSTHPGTATGALRILHAAGWVRPEKSEGRFVVTSLGHRGFSRGPGPFGIIETYHGYMHNGARILRHGRDQVWVARGENVGASQDANRATFQKANSSLERFCADTGYEPSVFIEHAIGRGEATRQRFEASQQKGLSWPSHYVGADLEDAAIDAALEEQAHGNLPAQMLFVRDADIGKPQILLDALAQHQLTEKHTVMMVGNGFHEVRNQSDERMVEVFAGYHEAGIILLFTEENALSIDDLRATAWNTYHAGFRYVHEKSGQCLRPADPRPPVKLGKPLRAAWSTCAQQAGYVRMDAYCTRTRSIYPYTPSNGFNPSISVNHFFIPAPLAERLGVR